MKKEGFSLIALILSLNFMSAAYGSFNNFSLSGLFSEMNIAMYLNGLLFITLFAVIYWLTSKSPLGENRAVSWIVALCISSFSMWGILKSGFSFEDLIYSMGVSEDMLPIFLAIVGIAVGIFLIWKFGFKKFIGIVFLLAGALLIILSILDQVYEKGVGIMLGILLMVIGMILNKKKAGNYSENSRTFRFGKKLGYGLAYSASKPKLLCFIILLLGMALLYFGITGGKLIFMGIGLVLLLLGLWCLFHKKRIPNSGLIPPKDSQNAPPQAIEKEKLIYQKRQRSIYDLKQKYIAYGNRFNQVSRSNPQESKRILQTMDIIIKMAKKQGVKEREFLSNKYIMNYKPVDEIRKKSGY